MHRFVPLILTVIAWITLSVESQAQPIEYLPFAVSFAPSGTFTVEPKTDLPLRPGAIAPPAELIAAGDTIRTATGGAVSLMLGESAESGTARLGPETEIILPYEAGLKNEASRKFRPLPQSYPSPHTNPNRHSLELTQGSVCLNLKAGQMVHEPGVVVPRFHVEAEFCLKTPRALVSTQVAKIFCTSLSGLETIGVLEGSVRVSVPSSEKILTLTAGQAVDVTGNVLGQVRDATTAERERCTQECQRAALTLTPLDVFVVANQKNGTSWQGWSRETKPPEQSWMGWEAAHSGLVLWGVYSKLTEKGTVVTYLTLSNRQDRTVFPIEVHVREGEPIKDAKGQVSIPRIPLSRLKAFRFRMRVINANSLIYHVRENYITSEKVIYFNPQASDWQEYHQPLTDAGNQKAVSPPQENLDTRDRFYIRFDYDASQLKAPQDKLIIEMEDFRAISLP